MARRRSRYLDPHQVPVQRLRNGLVPATPFWRRPGFLFFLTIVFIYNLNGRYAVGGDEWPQRLLPLALLHHGVFNFDPYIDVILIDGRLPHFAVSSAGHVVSTYPPGPALMALPFFLPTLLFEPDRLPLLLFAKLAASITTTLAALFVFLSARRLGAGLRAAAVVGGVFALATPAFPLAAQSLSQHAAAVLLVAAALYAATRVRQSRSSSWPVAATLLCGLALAARPQSAPAIVPLLAYVLWKSRRSVVLPLAGFILPVALQLAYNVAVGGSIQGGYALQNQEARLGRQRVMDFSGDLLEGLAGILFSPGRGLLFFTPVVFFAFFGIVKGWEKDGIYIASGAGLVASILFFAKYSIWWGGFGYGPRLLIEAMPLASILLVPLLSGSMRGAMALLFAFLLPISVAVQVVGAFTHSCSWDSVPVSVDDQPSRLWDLHDPPVLRCISDGPRFGGTGLLDPVHGLR